MQSASQNPKVTKLCLRLCQRRTNKKNNTIAKSWGVCVNKASVQTNKASCASICLRLTTRFSLKVPSGRSKQVKRPRPSRRGPCPSAPSLHNCVLWIQDIQLGNNSCLLLSMARARINKALQSLAHRCQSSAVHVRSCPSGEVRLGGLRWWGPALQTLTHNRQDTGRCALAPYFWSVCRMPQLWLPHARRLWFICC